MKFILLILLSSFNLNCKSSLVILSEDYKQSEEFVEDISQHRIKLNDSRYEAKLQIKKNLSKYKDEHTLNSTHDCTDQINYLIGCSQDETNFKNDDEMHEQKSTDQDTTEKTVTVYKVLYTGLSRLSADRKVAMIYKLRKKYQDDELFVSRHYLSYNYSVIVGDPFFTELEAQSLVHQLSSRKYVSLLKMPVIRKFEINLEEAKKILNKYIIFNNKEI